MTETVLCADIGTSSLKAAIIDCKGKVLARCRKQFLLCYTHEAASEWKKTFLEAAFYLLKEAGINKTDAICISGNGPTLVSESGKTLIWNEQVKQTCPSLFLDRIVFFKNNFAEDWKNSAHIISGPEFLIWQLTGNALTILPEERFKTAYWDNERLLEKNLSEDECSKLPPFVGPGEKAGFFELNGIKTPVYCGAPDFVSALIGTATVFPGKLCDRAGSSEGLNLCTPVPVSGEHIRTLPSAIPGLWNASYLLPDSGSRFSAYKAKIERQYGKSFSYNKLVHLFLNSTGNIPEIEDGKKIMTETALEIKKGIQILSEAMEKAGLNPPDSMTVTGGQAGNDEWNAYKAAIAGINIEIPQIHDGELLGDAVFAFTSMGLFKNFQDSAKKLFKAEKVFNGKLPLQQ